MRRALLGFIVGGFTIGLIFVLFASTLDGGILSGAAPSGDLVRATPTGGGFAESAQEIVTEEGADSTVAFEAPTAEETLESSLEDNLAREARLRRQLDEARRAANEAVTELEELALERYLENEPIVSPVPLPPEFDWVFENHYRQLFHEQFQREPVDATWAVSMESQLIDFIYRQSNLVETYGAPAIRCHATQCEVTFVAYGVDLETGSDPRSLLEGIHERMPDLIDCGPGECWAEGNWEDGVATIFVGFTTKEQELRSRVAEAGATS